MVGVLREKEKETTQNYTGKVNMRGRERSDTATKKNVEIVCRNWKRHGIDSSCRFQR
jgi:hypothetical protein